MKWVFCRLILYYSLRKIVQGGEYMSKLIIESTNKNDSVTDIEEKLEKAYTSIQMQRENKQFSDVFMKAQKDKADKVVTAVFNSMIAEISEVLKGGDS